MSNTGLSDTDKLHKKSFHRWNDSGELDVFEAARYFSGANEVPGAYNGAQKMMKSGGRISLDVPLRNSIPSQNIVMEKQTVKEKNYKQPSSPGGRLASFLNSIFNQTSLKMKKKSKSSTHSMKEEDESPSGRRKRRSSISHFRTSSNADSKSIYSSSSSGFRTPPPPYAHTPAKTYKDLRSYSDHKQKVSLSNYNSNGHVVKSTTLQSNEVCQDKRGIDHAWFDEKFNFSNGFSEKHKNFVNGFSEKVRIQGDKFPLEEKEFRKFDEIHDGGDSDSSSDLFELQNYDLGYCSSGLPVYETTHMDSIKRGAPIASGPI